MLRSGAPGEAPPQAPLFQSGMGFGSASPPLQRPAPILLTAWGSPRRLHSAQLHGEGMLLPWGSSCPEPLLLASASLLPKGRCRQGLSRGTKR